MSRFMEAVFVLACSLIGFGMGADHERVIERAVQYSVRMVKAYSGCEPIQAGRRQ